MMGFEPLGDDQVISAEFHSLIILSIRGLLTKSLSNPPTVFAGPSCRYAFGDDLNALSQALVGDGFNEDQEAWCREAKTSPPFLMIHVGPTDRAEVSSGFAKRDGKVLITHDCFTASKEQLVSIEKRVIGPLVTSLALALSGWQQPVQFVPVTRVEFGKLTTGETVVDLRFRMSANAYVSAPIDDSELGERIDYAARIRATLPEKISRFYYLGLAEDDPLKRFIFFFLFLERYTHSVFQRISREADPATVFAIPERLTQVGAKFAASSMEMAKSLFPRFVWCALITWQSINDEDVSRFKELHRARNDLSHGERTAVEAALADRARDLCAKLIQAEIPLQPTSETT